METSMKRRGANARPLMLAVSAGFFLTAMSLRPASAQSVLAAAYHVTSCRFSQFATCGASGPCPAPPDQIVNSVEYPVYHLDHHKFSPDTRDFPSTGYPITMLCPVTRASADGSSAVQAEVAIAPPQVGDLRCTLHSVTAYGFLSTMSSDARGPGSPAYDVLSMAISAGSNAGTTQYQLECIFPGGPGGSSAYMYGYRTSETVTAFLPDLTYPASICVPRATEATVGPTLGGSSGNLRYFVGTARNTDVANLNVECPLIDTGAYGAVHVADVYLTEAAGTSHSSCSLVVRSAYSRTVADSFPGTPITSDGSVHLSFTANTSYSDKMRFTVECTLTPGSSINSIALSR
jgi:hypothetical protein